MNKKIAFGKIIPKAYLFTRYVYRAGGLKETLSPNQREDNSLARRHCRVWMFAAFIKSNLSKMFNTQL